MDEAYTIRLFTAAQTLVEALSAARVSDPLFQERWTEDGLTSATIAVEQLLGEVDAPDPIYQALFDRLNKRRLHGLEHYGVSIHEAPGNFLHWMQEAQDEQLDMLVYYQLTMLRLAEVIDALPVTEG